MIRPTYLNVTPQRTDGRRVVALLAPLQLLLLLWGGALSLGNISEVYQQLFNVVFVTVARTAVLLRCLHRNQITISKKTCMSVAKY